MSKNYDNWERLVDAVLLRVKLRQLAMAESRNFSTLSELSFVSDDEFIVYKSQSPDFDDVSKWERLFQPSDYRRLFFLMAGSTNLTISCGNTSNDRQSFNRSMDEVADIGSVLWLDIRGKMNTQILTPNTIYGAYLVFKVYNDETGIGSAKSSIRFVNEETDSEAEKRAVTVHLQLVDWIVGEIPIEREDGWMEVKIGKFYVDQGDEDEVEARLMKTSFLKKGLLVQGVEFRPLYALKKGNHVLSSVQKPDVLELISWKMGKNDDGKVNEASVTAETEKVEETDIDLSLLQKFAQLSSDVRSDTGSRPLKSVRTPSLPLSAQSKQKNSTSLQDDGIDEEMGKLLLPKDELFSGGDECLSKVVYFFDGMKRMVKLKDGEIDDLKQTLCKNEVEAQLALAAKDSELEELKKMVNVLKSDIVKAQDTTREEVRKANEKVKKAEREVENAEARAASAIENYKNSHELKVDKHKFASKAFSIGFDVCKKQVLDVDPNFDITRVDIKFLEASSSSTLGSRSVI